MGAGEVSRESPATKLARGTSLRYISPQCETRENSYHSAAQYPFGGKNAVQDKTLSDRNNYVTQALEQMKIKKQNNINTIGYSMLEQFRLHDFRGYVFLTYAVSWSFLRVLPFFLLTFLT